MESVLSTTSENIIEAPIGNHVPDVTALVHHWRRPAWASLRSSQRIIADRFIPKRSTINMDIAQALLIVPRKEKNPDEVSPSRAAYRKLLADTLLQGKTRILSYNNQPHNLPFQEPPCLTQVQPTKQHRSISQVPERTLDAQYIVGDDQFNLLDWGSKNILSIALDDTVYLWNAANSTTSALMAVSESYAPITSVSWAEDGCLIAIASYNSVVHLYDATTNQRIRTLEGVHQGLVGSLAWNNSLLTTGSTDGAIINNDVRIRSHVIGAYRGHCDAVGSLKWSSSRQHLASGGADNLVHIWDVSRSHFVHRFNDHTAAVRAVAWCPFQSELLASGGAETDHSIKFWNVSSGACIKSVDTGSQVCGLLWSKNHRELMSSHGETRNQLTLWKYPSMAKVAELTGHTSPVLYLTQSPDGCTLASASADEMLKLWSISEKSPKKTMPKSMHVFGPSNMRSYIR